MGTGSGAIAVALAHALPRSLVTAVDLYPAALEVARRNAQRHGVAERVSFLQSDLLAKAGSAEFDAVVSNPPYIADAEVLEPQVADYEPRSALYAGPTGLEVYQRLIPQARRVLKPQGWLLMEIGYGQQPAVAPLLGGWRCPHLCSRFTGNPASGSGANALTSSGSLTKAGYPTSRSFFARCGIPQHLPSNSRVIRFT